MTGESRMNLPNILTLSRVPILFLIAALMSINVAGAATGALLLFIVAGITDWLDGAVARRMGLVSDFGKLMDALTDKILVVGAMVAIVVFRLAPAYTLFLVLLVLSREFLITGMRMMAASRGIIIAAEKAGKQKTVTQIVAVGLLLAAPVLSGDLAGWFGDSQFWQRAGDFTRAAGVFFFFLATLVTVTSGLRYFIKYWPQLGAGAKAKS